MIAEKEIEGERRRTIGSAGEEKGEREGEGGGWGGQTYSAVGGEFGKAAKDCKKWC